MFSVTPPLPWEMKCGLGVWKQGEGGGAEGGGGWWWKESQERFMKGKGGERWEEIYSTWKHSISQGVLKMLMEGIKSVRKQITFPWLFMVIAFFLKEQLSFRFYTLRVDVLEWSGWWGRKGRCGWLWPRGLDEDGRLILIHFIALSGSLPPPSHPPPPLPVLLSVSSPPPSFFPLSFFIDQAISPGFKHKKRKRKQEWDNKIKPNLIWKYLGGVERKNSDCTWRAHWSETKHMKWKWQDEWWPLPPLHPTPIRHCSLGQW